MLPDMLDRCRGQTFLNDATVTDEGRETISTEDKGSSSRYCWTTEGGDFTTPLRAAETDELTDALPQQEAFVAATFVVATVDG